MAQFAVQYEDQEDPTIRQLYDTAGFAFDCMNFAGNQGKQEHLQDFVRQYSNACPEELNNFVELIKNVIENQKNFMRAVLDSVQQGRGYHPRGDINMQIPRPEYLAPPVATPAA